MVNQEIDADYITKEQLVRLLKQKFGRDFSITLRGNHWVVDVPEYISDYEIQSVQEGR